MSLKLSQTDKSGTPIASVRKSDGKFSGQVLYLDSDGSAATSGGSPEIDAQMFARLTPGVKPVERMRKLTRIQDALDRQKPSLLKEPDEKELYETLLKSQEADRSIHLPDGNEFSVLPNADANGRDVIYITGQSGSGKSYFCRNFMESYHKLFPDRKIYLISYLDSDETLDNSKTLFKRIKMADYIEDPLDHDDFKNALLIADDYDQLPKKELKATQELLDKCVSMGRHSHCSILACLHRPTDYKNTKLLLCESQKMVIYPNSMTPYALDYLCKEYIGIPRGEVAKIKRLGRWVCFNKSPKWILSSHCAKLM